MAETSRASLSRLRESTSIARSLGVNSPPKDRRSERSVAGAPPQEPADALVISPKAKYLYVARDGRDVVWSHPAFADRCVFARNDKEIVCVSLQKR